MSEPLMDEQARNVDAAKSENVAQQKQQCKQMNWNKIQIYGNAAW